MVSTAPDFETATLYRFAGTVIASRLRGIEVGTPFHGTFRYDPDAPALEVGPFEARYADPRGHIEATVGEHRLRSVGSVEIGLFSTPQVSRLSLSATPAPRLAGSIRSCRLVLLSGRAIGGPDGLPAALDAQPFDTCSFTLEDAGYIGFALGSIATLTCDERRAA